MKGENKTKRWHAGELVDMRQRVAELEKAETGRKQVEQQHER